MMISKNTWQAWISNNTPIEDWTSEIRKAFWQGRKWAMTQEPATLPEEFVTALNTADRKFFLHWKPLLLLPPAFAWVLLILGILVEFLFLWTWKNVFASTKDSILIFIALFFILLIQYVLIHLPSHFLISKIVGIKIWKTFIESSSLRKGPFPLNYIFTLGLLPGLKYDLASFLKQSKIRRALMLSAGIWIPYSIFIINLSLFIFFPASSQPNIINIFILIFLVLFILLGFITSWFWYGDLYKARMIYKKFPHIEIET